MFFDYAKEPRNDIMCIDVKSFFASVECVMRGYDPLKKMLVVMSNADNPGGLILAASPMAKKVLGISNVSRKFELPNHPDLEVVPPRMALYVDYNAKINGIYREFVAEEELLVYSIDESFLDVTSGHLLFGEDTREIARKIRERILRETGLYVTIGIGDNPLLAKLAMDNAAKKDPEMMACWRYEDVPRTIWKIAPISKVWGIGERTARRLASIGICSMETLAHYDYDLLRKNLGVMGEQLYACAWGIDRSLLSQRYVPKEKSYGTSQVLLRDYDKQKEIEIVIREMTEQVAARLRKHEARSCCIHLYIRYSYHDTAGGFSHQLSIPATSSNKELVHYFLFLFRKHYGGQSVRQVGVTCSRLLFDAPMQFHLWESPQRQVADGRIDRVVDRVRERYGYTAVLHASSLLEGGTAIRRAGLMGGHASGAETM